MSSAQDNVCALAVLVVRARILRDLDAGVAETLVNTVNTLQSQPTLQSSNLFEYVRKLCDDTDKWLESWMQSKASVCNQVVLFVLNY